MAWCSLFFTLFLVFPLRRILVEKEHFKQVVYSANAQVNGSSLSCSFLFYTCRSKQGSIKAIKRIQNYAINKRYHSCKSSACWLVGVEEKKKH